MKFLRIAYPTKINYSIILSILILLLNFSCKKCPDQITLDNYYLSKKSKAKFPYKNGESKLIFKDSLNNKVVFELVSSDKIYLTENEWNENCTGNNSVVNRIKINAKREWQNISFKPDTLIDLSFNIVLKQVVEIDASDLNNIREIDGIKIYRANVGQMNIVTDLKNFILEEESTEKINSVTINGKLFKNVLKSRFMNSGGIYYDIEKGIVAINEYQGSFEKTKYWTLDSIIYREKNKKPKKIAKKIAKKIKYDKLKENYKLFGKWEIFDTNSEGSFQCEIYQKGTEFIYVVPPGDFYCDTLVKRGNKFSKKGIEKGEYYIIDSNKEMTLFDGNGNDLASEGYIAKKK
ncbi:hypothetical protein [Tenacibaculum ovolyticum]|uniref:hypothetical protein n=1 Tax=Tenacibaculum ovolyticum TaxID=104270 RepID=UPI003BA99A54